MHPQLGQALPVAVQPPGGCQSTKLVELQTGLLQGCRRWWVDPMQVPAKGIAPLGQLQGQGQGIYLEQLRWIESGTTLLFSGRPEAQAATWPQAPGPAGPLISAGLACGYGDEAIKSTSGIEAVAAAQTTVDHQRYPGQGEGTLSDGSGEHHLARGAAGRADSAALGLQGQVAVQGNALHALMAGLSPVGGGDRPAAVLDLPLPGEENQHGFAVAARL